MQFRLEAIHFHVLPTRTRFPFKYGIASLESLPHLFVGADIVVGGKVFRGVASDGLAPKWFTKDPDTTFETDLAVMLSVIQNAGRIGRVAAERDTDFFTWWNGLYEEQTRWAAHTGHPPLLANFGTSLIERAVLDALCQAVGRPFHQVMHHNLLGIDIAAVRPGYEVSPLQEVVLSKALPRVAIRHTIGLGDSLSSTVGDPSDGLPYTLVDSIRYYGLRWFKIKVSGKVESDLERLREITRILTIESKSGFQCTLDGNEQFYELKQFQDFYQQLSTEPALQPLMQSLVLIEQPLYRSVALDEAVGTTLRSWKNAPPMIIDESDGSLTDLPRALELGYRGTSHKNCKGIVKGLANAALLKRYPEPTVLSGEDLASIGPIATIKDIAVASALGITHVERNGHHYFRGLSMYLPDVQEMLLEAHQDTYHRHEQGFPTLHVKEGHVGLGSVNAFPFGSTPNFDITRYEKLNDWIKRGGLTLL